MSRNQREGKYAGWYKAPHKAKHWRTGKGDWSEYNMSLKEHSKFLKKIGG